MNERAGLLTAIFLLIPLVIFSEETMPFSADTFWSDFSKGSGRTILSGNAEIISNDMIIRADRIELYGENLIFALCTGKVVVVNDKDGLKMKSDKLTFNRRDKITRIQGNAYLEDKVNEIVIKGGIIENREKEDTILVQIGVRILKEDLVCRSQMARFFRGEKKLELSGMPVVWWKDDKYQATKIFIELEENDVKEVRMEGNVQAQVKYRTNEETNEGQ